MKVRLKLSKMKTKLSKKSKNVSVQNLKIKKGKNSFQKMTLVMQCMQCVNKLFYYCLPVLLLLFENIYAINEIQPSLYFQSFIYFSLIFLFFVLCPSSFFFYLLLSLLLFSVFILLFVLLFCIVISHDRFFVCFSSLTLLIPDHLFSFSLFSWPYLLPSPPITFLSSLPFSSYLLHSLPFLSFPLLFSFNFFSLPPVSFFSPLSYLLFDTYNFVFHFFDTFKQKKSNIEFQTLFYSTLFCIVLFETFFSVFWFQYIFFSILLTILEISEKLTNKTKKHLLIKFNIKNTKIFNTPIYFS